MVKPEQVGVRLAEGNSELSPRCDIHNYYPVQVKLRIEHQLESGSAGIAMDNNTVCTVSRGSATDSTVAHNLPPGTHSLAIIPQDGTRGEITVTLTEVCGTHGELLSNTTQTLIFYKQ